MSPEFGRALGRVEDVDANEVRTQCGDSLFELIGTWHGRTHYARVDHPQIRVRSGANNPDDGRYGILSEKFPRASCRRGPCAFRSAVTIQ